MISSQPEHFVVDTMKHVDTPPDTVNSDTINLNTVNLNTVNLNMVNLNMVNSNTVNSNMVNSNTVNLNTVNLNMVNSNTVNSNMVNSNMVNSNTVNSKFDLIQNYCQMFLGMLCLKCTVNTNSTCEQLVVDANKHVDTNFTRQTLLKLFHTPADILSNTMVPESYIQFYLHSHYNLIALHNEYSISPVDILSNMMVLNHTFSFIFTTITI